MGIHSIFHFSLQHLFLSILHIQYSTFHIRAETHACLQVQCLLISQT